MALLLVDKEVLANDNDTTWSFNFISRRSGHWDELMSTLGYWFRHLPDDVVQAQVYLINNHHFLVKPGDHCGIVSVLISIVYFEASKLWILEPIIQGDNIKCQSM
jgi:hypothetical protein